MVIWKENTSAKKCSLSEAIQIKKGDRIVFDANWRGVYPKLVHATVLGISGGLASHGDTKPGAILQIKTDKGITGGIDIWAVEEVNGKPFSAWH